MCVSLCSCVCVCVHVRLYVCPYPCMCVCAHMCSLLKDLYQVKVFQMSLPPEEANLSEVVAKEIEVWLPRSNAFTVPLWPFHEVNMLLHSLSLGHA